MWCGCNSDLVGPLQFYDWFSSSINIQVVLKIIIIKLAKKNELTKK